MNILVISFVGGKFSLFSKYASWMAKYVFSLVFNPCLSPGSGELQESLRAGPNQRPRPQDLRSHAGAADSARPSQVLGGGQIIDWVLKV